MKHPSLKPWLMLALLAGMAALTPGRAAPSGAAAAQGAPACAPLLQHSFLRLQDEKPQTLCQYSGKVLVVVNTASFCGFTRQYAGLEALYARYRDQGLVVLGFPSNDFSQESGSNREIADFCENTFGVKFPMFVKSSVSGTTANPLFRQLARQTGQRPRWNFHKYVVARDGQRVTSFNTATDPNDPAFLKDIEEKLLGR
ncbi:MAG: glutathione peroxidase [Polaromonas sp.]|uniref:glutathione peroxidase n=1 Tax=Polaromonas sp. TaxID=1869339 RepID=UPI002730EA14|nr:glutathione peroxidase [Polaromonas sp.]MDP2451250.1 glutathione peroxidase [Polaromonas sp.]MDP3246379.1 glutathione peroxidase [Polaromonas sp.]MDP3756036.1 glutathione peroxidase [Polaromonas sp.]